MFGTIDFSFSISVLALIICIVLALPTIIISAFLIVWGALDVYAMWRFRKNNLVDQTSIFGNWLFFKWMIASRTKEMVEKLPWLKQDLSEILKVKPDDGETT